MTLRLLVNGTTGIELDFDPLSLRILEAIPWPRAKTHPFDHSFCQFPATRPSRPSVLSSEATRGEVLLVRYYRKLIWCACGGARLSGNELEFRVTTFCSRWERICLITYGSSILARTLTAPPHASQVDMSILNTHFMRCAQLMAVSPRLGTCCLVGDYLTDPFRVS
jgi:hypothetical protein